MFFTYPVIFGCLIGCNVIIIIIVIFASDKKLMPLSTGKLVRYQYFNDAHIVYFNRIFGKMKLLYLIPLPPNFKNCLTIYYIILRKKMYYFIFYLSCWAYYTIYFYYILLVFVSLDHTYSNINLFNTFLFCFLFLQIILCINLDPILVSFFVVLIIMFRPFSIFFFVFSIVLFPFHPNDSLTFSQAPKVNLIINSFNRNNHKIIETHRLLCHILTVWRK